MVKIVILGGGFGGIYTLKYLHKFFHNQKEIKLVLVNKKNYFLFTPLLHELATGGVSLENIVEPIRRIIQNPSFDFIYDEVIRIDLNNKIVIGKSHKLNFDYLIIALGSTTNFYKIPGAEENSFTLKSLEDALRLKRHFILSFEKGDNLTFVIVGGGATGVEIACEMSDYFFGTFSKIFPKEIFQKVRLILIEKGQELLPQFSPKLRKIALEVLKKKKINVLLGKSVIEVGKDFLKLDDGTEIKTKTVIWTAGVKANLPEIIGNIEKDKNERLIVDEYLRLKNYQNVFALGDNACFLQDDRPLAQLAQVAVREAKVVAENIKNLIKNKPLKKFTYYHQGDLISLGRFFAIGEIKNFILSGRLIWFLWRGVYLWKMISPSKKIRTFLNWLIDCFYSRDINEI